MHAAAFSPRGGGSPRSARLRGQSIIEYVLVIAIIGLVVVFAGPQVSGAIRNQFNQVTNTVDSGTDGDSFISAEEKAYREAMKTVVNKDAKDWTLDEQKAAATDIAKNGTSSVVYAKAKAAMETGSEWSVKLTNGKTMTYRIVGINHDDLADGSGKSGADVPHNLDRHSVPHERYRRQRRRLGEVGAAPEDEFRRDLEPHAGRFSVQGETRQQAHKQRHWNR